MRWKRKRKRPVCCSQPTTQLRPPCCHRCLTNRSVRGYEKSPQYYFLLLKCASFFPPTTCNHTWESWKVIWFLRAWQLPIKAEFFLFFFLFEGNYLNQLPRVTCAAFFKAKPQRAKSVIPSFSKHTYITATVPVTVILNPLSQENFWDSRHKKGFVCEFCSGFQPETYKWQSEISSVYTL